jgi:DNA-binding NarL/FixJ family response regulator
MDVLTGTAIAKLAFDEFIKSGAGELAKKSVGGAIEQLRSTIKKRFVGKNDKAEVAIATLEADSDGAIDKAASLNKLSVYLDDEMDDVVFAESLRQLAQQLPSQEQVVMRQENREQSTGYQIYAERIDRVGDDYRK